MRDTQGIYVEIYLRAPLEEVWRLTQQPEEHQRWDLRFSTIEYLPRPSLDEPQRFLYTTRIGFGLTIRGTGESVGEARTPSGEATSSLRFASEDAKSLIRSGSGYWRYVPLGEGVRFFTWYDYTTRFGPLGRLADLLFRPLIGWATAWSFDCLRLWLEEGQSPELSIHLSAIHAAARLTLAFVWLWHGLVPKLLFHHRDELMMLAQSGIATPSLHTALNLFGSAEILFGIILLLTWRVRWIFLANAVAMVLATLAVSIRSPSYITSAFNPVTLNLSVFALAIIGWFASSSLPTATRCKRRQPAPGDPA